MQFDNPFSRKIDFSKYAQEVVQEIKVEFEEMRKENSL